MIRFTFRRAVPAALVLLSFAALPAVAEPRSERVTTKIQTSALGKTPRVEARLAVATPAIPAVATEAQTAVAETAPAAERPRAVRIILPSPYAR
jgi:hypothetical protein